MPAINVEIAERPDYDAMLVISCNMRLVTFYAYCELSMLNYALIICKSSPLMTSIGTIIHALSHSYEIKIEIKIEIAYYLFFIYDNNIGKLDQLLSNDHQYFVIKDT
jgi:hypothetical protein